jgi:hypothetical protein
MAEYPTSIRLTTVDKRKLRKYADKWQLSLASLIQMILRQWLEKQGPPKPVEPKIEEIQNDAG